RHRLVAVTAPGGEARNLIDEKSETFVWTQHFDGFNFAAVTWLAKSTEIIHATETSGWRHLYLLNAATGERKSAITSGEYVVRGIDYIDEEKRQVWFRACGKNAGEDPYHVHHYRVNFDGSSLVALTAGNGSHGVLYSPDRRFLIDTYSRVDAAPVTELRSCADGKLVCRLEAADTSELAENGLPEVFHAKGRDGTTDIWGLICKPRNFDPKKRYPVIEYIYAGPHGSHVPKAFRAFPWHRALTDLGFVVVQIDGMGTANRSKPFHDVCWHNLKDAGFPDRILWHRAVAARYPWYDAERVGIYGTSAGGQNAMGALLFHGDFYRAAMAACGCHDNRLDKASWNEQWMGYPAGPHYAACSNVDNAHRLRGRLLLVVGEMDTNVPPESTFRVADALVKANKDFELLVVPGMGHSDGGGYGRRRTQDFFVRHLHGVEPPDRNRVELPRR
ncbi:MAG TPA: prolyl oligopeptidase family serine peptidase, partial [Urbifossiella sp.]|nr:prolyl oligopeptidase family serine peptidase [Urbifossiella sp.]